MVDLASRCEVDRCQRPILVSSNEAYATFKCGFYLSSFFLFVEYYALGQSSRSLLAATFSYLTVKEVACFKGLIEF